MEEKFDFNEDCSPEIEGAEQEIVEPENIDDWNWGAFAFGAFWGLFNKLYWPFAVGIVLWLLQIVFVVTEQESLAKGFSYIDKAYVLFISLWLGRDGNRVAWSDYSGTAEQFERKQRGWSIAGKIALAVVLTLVVVVIVGIMSL